MLNKKISVIGLGYIGLPTAALIASRGYDVVGVDVNQNAIDTINRGEIHIIEPELDVVVRSVVTTGKLKATTVPEASDIFLIAVPTPFKEDKKPDLSYVEQATRSISKVLKKGDLVILESTSPVGTTDKMANWLSEERPDLKVPSSNSSISDIFLAHCPERVLPGHVLRELVENDRIIGGINQTSSQMAVDFYKTFVNGGCYITDAKTAEMAKLTENTFRDVNIAFANELSIICDHLDIDVWELIELANKHPRVNILQPGPGVGGHCLAVDPWFIVDSAPEHSRIIEMGRRVNDEKPNFVVDKIYSTFTLSSTPVIACFGASFKPDIDDLRQSPALSVILELARNTKNRVLVVEPNITKLPEALNSYENVELVSLQTALTDMEVGALLVAHKEFKEVKTALLQNPKVIQFVNF
ncbi:MAG: UDP-N-acetyl-D-mannosamine dehydrogenase [Oceanospirillaceae bacterium]|nr:UDP-N-acetyl-D-mannosamine dehydrogenase [Oceanospirillaceae bacterium]